MLTTPQATTAALGGAADGQVVQQPEGQLRHGKDEDQVEEQLEGRDVLLGSAWQQTLVVPIADRPFALVAPGEILSQRSGPSVLPGAGPGDGRQRTLQQAALRGRPPAVLARILCPIGGQAGKKTA